MDVQIVQSMDGILWLNVNWYLLYVHRVHVGSSLQSLYIKFNQYSFKTSLENTVWVYILEPTSTISNEDEVYCSRKQQEPFMGLKLTTAVLDMLPVLSSGCSALIWQKVYIVQIETGSLQVVINWILICKSVCLIEMCKQSFCFESKTFILNINLCCLSCLSI